MKMKFSASFVRLLYDRAHDAWNNYIPPSSHHNSLSVLLSRKRKKSSQTWMWIHGTEMKRGVEVFLYLHSHRRIHSLASSLLLLLPVKRYKFSRIINPFLACVWMNTISKWNSAHKYTHKKRRGHDWGESQRQLSTVFINAAMIFHKAFLCCLFLSCVCVIMSSIYNRNIIFP